ncbi:hypothetical protein COB21_03970 [Candidatus Aerophobetes bacterium]|uniref:Uncharacterized protein n=1 Tax=Aerophobetes bacterium TaxID=2030807 RepID=A0A2A4X2L4_UNCAE|nr:MAG: hypothetical protein COB21_03970 [Candidatus Aerophobetes bacterium]
MVTLLLVDSYADRPKGRVVASLEDGKKLELVDTLFKKSMSMNGITLPEKRNGAWRIFPDGDPAQFLAAFREKMATDGAGRYHWVSQEEYDDPTIEAQRVARKILGTIRE